MTIEDGKLQGWQLIQQDAQQRRSGMIFDEQVAEAVALLSLAEEKGLVGQTMDPRVRRAADLFPHLPESLQNGVKNGEITVLVDFTGNSAIHSIKK